MCKIGIYLPATWILSAYERVICLVYLFLSFLLCQENSHNTVILISSLSVSCWICKAESMHKKWYWTSLFQRWKPYYLNLLLIIVFGFIIVSEKKLLIMFSQCIGRVVFGGSRKPNEAFAASLSRSAERFNEIGNNGVISACKWQTDWLFS